MPPYLYRRLIREKLAQLRQGGGHAPHVRHVYVSRPNLGRCSCFRSSTRMGRPLLAQTTPSQPAAERQPSPFEQSATKGAVKCNSNRLTGSRRQ